MIRGVVSGDREIVIPLEVLGVDQNALKIQVVLDTGFNGYLTLPLYVLNALGASAAGTRRVELGDGNLVELDVYIVSVRWYDEDRDVLAIQAEAAPLVGMSLLWGSRIRFDAENGGSVVIKAIPSSS